MKERQKGVEAGKCVGFLRSSGLMASIFSGIVGCRQRGETIQEKQKNKKERKEQSVDIPENTSFHGLGREGGSIPKGMSWEWSPIANILFLVSLVRTKEYDVSCPEGHKPKCVRFGPHWSKPSS